MPLNIGPSTLPTPLPKSTIAPPTFLPTLATLPPISLPTLPGPAYGYARSSGRLPRRAARAAPPGPPATPGTCGRSARGSSTPGRQVPGSPASYPPAEAHREIAPPPAIHLKPGREARMTARTAISSNSDLWGSTVGFAGEHSSAGPGRQLPSNLTWCRSRLSAAHGSPGIPVDCSGRVHAPSCRGARYVSAPKSIMGPMRRRAAQARPPG